MATDLEPRFVQLTMFGLPVEIRLDAAKDRIVLSPEIMAKIMESHIYEQFEALEYGST